MKKGNLTGFTLIEVLVVISLLSVVGVLILTIFTRTLRGSNKAQIIETIKQNGQSVLEQLDKTIRNSDNVVCPTIIPPDTSAPSSNLVVVKNGTYIRYRFVAPSPPPNPTTNGFIQQDNPDKQDVAGSNPLRKETDSEFVNRVCGANDTMPNSVTLTDTNPQTGVSVDCIAPDRITPNCSTNPIFSRNKSAGFRDQLTIKFDLWSGKGAPQSVTGLIDPVSFQTTIQLR